jgi:hypothetical protein
VSIHHDSDDEPEFLTEVAFSEFETNFVAICVTMSSAMMVADGLAVVFFAYIAFRFATRSKYPLPPGPKEIPWIGSAFRWPTKDAWVTFMQWGEIYGASQISRVSLKNNLLIDTPGPIMSFTVFGNCIIVLTSAQAVYDLLDQKGAIYSDRPIRPILDAAGISQGLTMSSYNPRVKEMRRMVANEVGGKAGTERFLDVIGTERHRLLRRLLEDPSNFAKHIRLYVIFITPLPVLLTEH